MKIRLPQKATLWAILAGFAYVLSFPRYDLPALGVLFLPAVLFSVHEVRTRRQAALLGFLLSAMVAWGGFQWIAYVARYFGDMPGPAAIGLVFIFCLVAAPQMVGFYLVGFYLRGPVARLPLFVRPVFWAATYVFLEYLARFVKIFPEHLGNTWLAYPALAQTASLGGVSALSFLPLLLGASLYYLRIRGLRALPAAATAAALVLALGFFGQRRLEALRAAPHDVLKVGLVQQNLEEIEKLIPRLGGVAALDLSVSTLTQETRALLASAKERPDLVVWPETSYPLTFPTPSGKSLNFAALGYAKLVTDLENEVHVPLLFGGYESVNGLDYNAAILLGADGRVEATYRKNVLLVFGEYMPFADYFPVLKTLNPMVGEFGRGAGPVPVPFSFAGRPLPLGVNICYEAILPEYMRGLVKGGARVLVNLTKDSWFGDTFEPWQHFQLAALRAIELGVPLVRSTNTGLSGFVLPTGEIQILSDPFRRAAAVVAVPVPREASPTVYARFGEWFAWACLLLALALGTWGFRKQG